MPRAPAAPAPDPRRTKLLETAFTVFTRYGFRKTTMEEVARAADLSRQGLYLHFSNKEELFRATLEHALDSAMRAAELAIVAPGVPLQARLLGALDAWVGRYVGVFGESATDLGEVSGALAGELIESYERRFVAALSHALKEAGAAAAYRPAGVSARQLAETLHATARGLKHSTTREQFVKGVTVAVKAMCLPLRGAP